MNKVFILLLMTVFVSSCGLFQKTKRPAAEKIATVAQGMAVKHLGCESGEAVKADVQEQLERLFKVKKEGFVLGASSDGRSIWGTVCSTSVKTVLPFLINFGSKKLPESWRDDGCSLKLVGDKVEDLALKLCNEV